MERLFCQVFFVSYEYFHGYVHNAIDKWIYIAIRNILLGGIIDATRRLDSA